MKQVLHRYRWLVMAFIITMLFIIGWMAKVHNAERAVLQQSVYENYSAEINAQVNMLISEQKSASLSLALMLSENPTVKTLLKQPCCTMQGGLRQMADKIERNSNITSIWLQAINREGVSLERSWIDRRGDSLIGIRKDLENLLKNPRTAPTTTVSTGLFSMTFKTMVPVFEDQELLGVVEVVSQFQPLIDRFVQAHSTSLVLADQRHRSKIVLPRSERFIGDYYVVNTHNADASIELVEQVGIEQVVKMNDFMIAQNHLITRVPILDSIGDTEGHWIVVKPLESFDFSSVEVILDRYLLFGSIVVIMLVLLGFLFLSRQQVYLQRNYYRDVIDSASDILYVTNLKRIVDANRHFFELFREFETIDDFHKKYQCVCDTFEAGEGLIQREVDGIYWIQYILNHPAEVHKAKIVRGHRIYYFSIKIQPLKQDLFGQYTVALQDITEMENIQHQLAYLSQTDELTGIGNRLFFNKSLSQEMVRAKRYQSPLCILMFDVDFFKEINDGFGHDVGDAVLQQLTQLVAESLRETDLFCRYGGEEFIVLLIETDMETASHVAQRLLKKIAEHDFSALPEQRLTCSFGLTCMLETDDENSILKRVDNALYDAKNDGRNCIVIG